MRGRGQRATLAALRAALLGLGLAAVPAQLLPRDAQAQGRAGAETEEEKVFGEAEAAFEAGRYGDAAPLYDRALSLNPTRPATFVKRATLYFRERRYEQAIDLLLRAERLAPDDLSLKTVLGLCLYQSGQRDRALRYLEDVTARRPEAYEAQLQIGQHYAQRDADRAIAALEQYLRFRPEDGKGLDGIAQLHLGQARFLKGQLPEAAAALAAALQARPKDPQVQLSIAALQLARGDYAAAARAFEAFLPDVQRRPRVAYNLALCYLRLGRAVEANRLAAQYAALRPTDPRGQVLLGDVVLAGGKDVHVRAALRHYEEAARLGRGLDRADQPQVSLDARAARAHLVVRDPARAIAAAEPALQRLRPGEGRAAAEEAELLGVLLEAAVQEVQAGAAPRPLLLQGAARLSQLLPQDGGALALCGSAALAAGNLERARKHYADALAVEPRQRRARLGLVRTLSRLAQKALEEPGGAVTAVGLLEQALPLDDTTTSARNLAVAYLVDGRPDGAERVLAPLLGKGQGDVVLLRLHGRALLAAGRAPEALAAYERAAAEAQAQLQGAAAEARPALAAQLGEIRVELGAKLLQAGRYDEAVETLERAAKEPGEGDEALRALSRNLSLAYLGRGRARLVELEAQLDRGAAPPVKLAEGAVEDLQRAVDRGGLLPGRREAGQALCLAALAATQATRYHVGRELLAKAAAEGGCELAPPYDKLGPELLSAYVSYRDTGSMSQRERALRSLPKLIGKSGQSAPLQQLTRSLLRSTNVLLAYDYYTAGKAPRAGQLLRAAQKVQATQTGKGEEADATLQHNLAVIELSEGRPSGERTLERLGTRPPEALVNLGILRDRRGEPKKALELYKRALERGARTPKLREWIDVKERILGGTP